jgi:hypothetical protein
MNREGPLRRERDAVLAAFDRVLERLSPDVCETEWGKMLGQGLFEFRIRHDATEIDAILEASPRGRAKRGEHVLLRVFCHAYGRRVVVLLGAYDKGRDPSNRRQQAEIDKARARLTDFRARQSAARRAAKKAGGSSGGA